MTALELAGNATPVAIDHEAILKSLNLNPRDPKTQALLLVCERYALDPLLKHMVLISGNPYITRDGLLTVAHRSGHFDGMEVLEQYETETHHVAKVAVYRNDMGRPFTFVGRFPKSKQMAKEYGPEMAVKVAEVMALRRAFNVTGVGVSEERWDAIDVDQPADGGFVEGSPAKVASSEAHQLLRDAIGMLAIEQQRALGEWWKEQRFPGIRDADTLTDDQVSAAERKVDELAQAAVDETAAREQALKALMVTVGKAFPCDDAPKGEKTRRRDVLRHAATDVVLDGHRSATEMTVDELTTVERWLHNNVLQSSTPVRFDVRDDGTVLASFNGQDVEVPPMTREEAA